MGAVGLPGAVSYISSIAPICIAMGSPITALGLLVAVETLPDLVRTVGNVALDIAVTATVGRRRPGDAAPGETDALLEGDVRYGCRHQPRQPTQRASPWPTHS